MGKKGTKRKTKWRALPLGEEAGGSGNEEELHDEDQSTTSSIVGQSANCNGSAYKRQSTYYRVAEKPYRQAKRFPYDRFRIKEPLVKLESKTFDEEEYTKITTPRQDVLFKKGYFGRKRESSAEGTANHTGEVDEEPMMDQIIITNGFVDEQGHYLVNSYEIYDPYSNTVTVVVGPPPPYANGVTQPVLATVSCQPVALQPVDWYPPGSEWPSQGSSWTPSFHGNPPQDPVSPPENSPAFPPPPPDAQLFNQPAYVVPAPGFVYRESPVFNGVSLQTSDPSPATEIQSSDEDGTENKLKKTRRKSTESNGEEEIKGKPPTTEEPAAPRDSVESPIAAQEKPEAVEAPPPLREEPPPAGLSSNGPTEAKRVEKQSHSTQTNLPEGSEAPAPLGRGPPGKESHSTQTLPEETFQTTRKDSKAQKETRKGPSDPATPSPAKPQENKFREGHNSPKRHWEDFQLPRKIYQQRTNFGEERKLKTENADEGDAKPEASPMRISYAKKAMIGLENGLDKNPKNANANARSAHVPVANGTTQVPTANGTNRGNHAKNASGERNVCHEDKRNVNVIVNVNGSGNAKNGYVKTRYGRSSPGSRPTNDRSGPKYKDRRVHLKPFEEVAEKKCEEGTPVEESRSHSEKSSTVSELSSPTELSSGQNTPPEKLIVRKMEQEINKSFEEKLKQNFTKKNEEEKRESEEEKKEGGEGKEGPAEDEEEAEKPKARPAEQKKKKTKGKPDAERADGGKEPARTPKGRKKKRIPGDSKEKSESENSGEDASFLPGFIRQKPQDLLFGGWEGMKDEGRNLISEMGSLFDGDEEILRSLGLGEDRPSFSKLPLHSDLLMMLPAFGWGRPKLSIEDFFSPAYFHNDLFTERNITSMKSTRPEEFFASVVDGPASPAEKADKKKEAQRNAKKEGERTDKAERGDHPRETSSKKNANSTKTGYKVSKNGKSKSVREEPLPKKAETEVEKEAAAKTEAEAATESKDVKFGIVEAVNTWLQEQGNSDVLSAEGFLRLAERDGGGGEGTMAEEEEGEDEASQKNGKGNPIHASSRSGEGGEGRREAGGGGGCMRVANVITDGFVHVDKEFSPRKRGARRMYRSSSWDAKLSEGKLTKHLKFLTDSASFCQDLISDVRNGLPARHEYATEELCDPKQIVSKYYTLAPDGRGGRGKVAGDSDSENEVFDALEYKFAGKEGLGGEEAEGKGPEGTGNVSVTDSGVLSDMESSEDAANDHHRETACKLQ